MFVTSIPERVEECEKDGDTYLALFDYFTKYSVAQKIDNVEADTICRERERDVCVSHIRL